MCPSDNCRRAYSLHETTSLFGEPALLIVWGRIGSVRVRLECFDSRGDRDVRRLELLRRRSRHGYSPVDGIGHR